MMWSSVYGGHGLLQALNGKLPEQDKLASKQKARGKVLSFQTLTD
jgi:hypothetical protein